MTDTDNFYLNKTEPNKSCLLAMRNLVLNSDAAVSETLKYGMPCFLYKDKVFCYLWTDKTSLEPYFLMVEGKYLNHPKLEIGDRARMKILRINPEKDLPMHTIISVLNNALDLYKNGTIDIKIKK